MSTFLSNANSKEPRGAEGPILGPSATSKLNKLSLGVQKNKGKFIFFGLAAVAETKIETEILNKNG